jgi:hypothetical protein
VAPGEDRRVGAGDRGGGAGSLDARVLPQLRRLEEAGAGSEKPLPPLVGLETPARLIVAPELTENEEANAAGTPSAEAASGSRAAVRRAI